MNMILLGGSHLYRCRIHRWMRCKTSITDRNWLPFYRVLAYNKIIAMMYLCIFAVAPRRGAWIEIFGPAVLNHGRLGSLPAGERGLKYQKVASKAATSGSLPAGERGLKSGSLRTPEARPRSLPAGERGLKSLNGHKTFSQRRSLPAGERGLK